MVTHLVPGTFGSEAERDTLRCCGRRTGEVPGTDHITHNEDAVTCPGGPVNANICIICGHDSQAHCFHAHHGNVSCCTSCPSGKCTPRETVLVYDVATDR